MVFDTHSTFVRGFYCLQCPCRCHLGAKTVAQRALTSRSLLSLSTLAVVEWSLEMAYIMVRVYNFQSWVALAEVRRGETILRGCK